MESDADMEEFLHGDDNGDDVVLQRSSLPDLFHSGKRNLVRRFFGKTKLLEPTYESLVVIWLEKSSSSSSSSSSSRKRWAEYLPEFLKFYFDLEESEEEKDKDDEISNQISVRIYNDVPLANVLATLPFHKLVFKPTDAVRLDLIR